MLHRDKANNVTDLFTEMMNKFIVVKQEASGWSYYCITEEERERYIEEFLQRADIKLEFSKIVENPGLCSLPMLILNSFWFMFGQQENQPKTNIVRDYPEFFSVLAITSIYVNSALTINEDTLLNWSTWSGS